MSLSDRSERNGNPDVSDRTDVWAPWGAPPAFPIPQLDHRLSERSLQSLRPEAAAASLGQAIMLSQLPHDLCSVTLSEFQSDDRRVPAGAVQRWSGP
ncbi:MAG: hypothetical protein ACR2N9_04740 [Acidimicrobiia bacterium]